MRNEAPKSFTSSVRSVAKNGSQAAKPGSEADACECCGSFDGVLEMGGQRLCADCVALADCGCAGHGNDDAA